jgi:hypothetical protein
VTALLNRVGVKITNAVGTMWCALVFAGIALVSLPSALSSRSLIVIVAWVAQTFLQLVLLSIIMVGQAVQAASLEQTIKETHDASLAEFELAKNALAEHREEMAALSAVVAAVHAQITDGSATA